MANFIDYFFLKCTRIINIIKKDESEARFSAFLFTGLYLTAIGISILLIFGLSHANVLTNLFKQYQFGFVLILDLLILAILGIRYYYLIPYQNIELAYNSLIKSKRIIIDTIIFITMITVPIIAFMLVRIFLVGHL